jgi:hypothetical protein
MDKFEVLEERAQLGKCSLFIGASQLAVPGDVRGKDGRKLPGLRHMPE